MTKTKARAREIIYWPGMAKDIKMLISKCQICEKYQKANVKEFLKPMEIPAAPFQKIAVDILEFGGQYYMAAIDYYFIWLEVGKLKNKCSSEIIKKLKKIFATHGIPEIVVADNNPFGSLECKEFARNWEFEIVTTSPHHHQANGMAESGIQIAKSLLRKNTDLQLSLLEYRTTPIQILNKSPAQLLQNRILKAKLPITNQARQIEISNPEEIKDKLKEKRDKYTNYYNKTARNLEELEEGEDVLININTNKNKEWERGIISNKYPTPRSYVVKNQIGNEVRRNRIHLKKSKNKTEFRNQVQIEEERNGEETRNEARNKTITSEEGRKKRIRRIPKRFEDYVLYK